MIDPKETGKRLNEHRQTRGMSQQEVAALLNVTHQAVSKWETGASLPDMQTLLALSRLYQTTMEELLIGTVSHAAPQPDGTAEDIVPDTLPNLSFSEIMSMVPFLEEKTVDALVERLGDDLAQEQLMSLAPFLSQQRLVSLFHSARGKRRRGELMALMPFLPRGMLDDLVLGEGITGHASRAQAPNPAAQADESRAQRALREGDDEWLDEHAEAFDARALLKLCAFARQNGLEEGLHLLLEHADRSAVSDLIALATKAEDWALVALAARCIA